MTINDYYFSIHGCHVEGYSLNIYLKGPDRIYSNLTSLSPIWRKPKLFSSFPEVLDELERFEVELNEKGGVQGKNETIEEA